MSIEEMEGFLYNHRMRLEKLELSGFKSFAEKTVFEFPKEFTAIVGPNGSGKSNISDAIRWVLGEQSMKTLRGKSSHDVIFHGSDNLSKLGMAHVALHLDNSDGKLPVEYADVTISRKVFASGESEYRINNAKVRLQDIILLLAQAKFGQKSYAVIGQGMITSFLNANPQERKEFFDEATGVKEFQIKRDQSINKLIRTEENLVQAETLMNEIEPHLQSLERQVKRLEKREKLEAELRELQIALYGSTLSQLGTEQINIRTQLAEKERLLAELEGQLITQQAANDAISQEASRGERYQQLQKQLNELLERKGQLLKEQAVLKGKLEVEHQRQGELSLVWMQRKEDEIMASIRTQEEEMLVLEEQLKQEQRTVERAQKTLKSLQDEFRAEEYNVLKLKEQIEQQSHAMTVPEIQESLRELFEEQEQFLRELLATKSLDEFKAVQSRGKHFGRRFAEFMDRLNADQKETLEALRVEMKHKEQLLGKLIAERDQAQHGVNELRVSIESSHAKMKLLHGQITRSQDELAQIQGTLEESKGAVNNQAQTVEYHASLQELTTQIEELEHQMNGVRQEIDQFNQEEEEKKTRLVAIQSEMRSIQRKINGAQQEANTFEIQMARIETRLEDVHNEILREVPEVLHTAITTYNSSEVVDHGAVEHKIGSLQRQLEVIGSVDEQTIQEYNETRERFTFLSEQTGDLSKSIESLETIIDELDATIRAQFQKNFKKINEGFQEYFKVLFNGGKAKLEMLTDADEEAEAIQEPGTEETEVESIQEEKVRELIGKKKKRQKVVSGIDIFAQPPGKKITNVSALSGGEKSMVSIALLCAIIAHNPSPFVFLDEVEAALDEENSEKLAAILKALAQKTQIIIITHNRVTMRAADILYGVTMGREGKSHILSVELEEAEEMAEEEPTPAAV